MSAELMTMLGPKAAIDGRITFWEGSKNPYCPQQRQIPNRAIPGLAGLLALMCLSCKRWFGFGLPKLFSWMACALNSERAGARASLSVYNYNVAWRHVDACIPCAGFWFGLDFWSCREKAETCVAWAIWRVCAECAGQVQMQGALTLTNVLTSVWKKVGVRRCDSFVFACVAQAQRALFRQRSCGRKARRATLGIGQAVVASE